MLKWPQTYQQSLAPNKQEADTTLTLTGAIRKVSLSDVLQNRFGKPSFLNVALSSSKTEATAWILFNIRPLTLTSPPTSISNQVGRKWFDLGEKQSIWKSNRLGHEVLPRLFDLVCSCWFWQWEILTAGVYFFTPSTFNAPWKQTHLPPVLWFLSEATESTGKHGLSWRTMWQAVVLQVCEMSQPKQCSDSKSTSSQVGVKESQVSSGVNWVD